MPSNFQVHFPAGNKSGKLKYHLYLVLLPLLLITACSEQPTTVTTIGILLFGDSRQAQVDGFINTMTEAGFGESESTRYVIRNANNDRKKLRPLLEDLVNQSPSILIAAGGLEADVMKKSTILKNTPVVVLYVNAIIERGLVESRTQSGWHVTGVDNLNAELSGKRVELIRDMLPDAKRILVLYYEKIAPSRIGVREANAVAQKVGLTIDARAVTSRADMETTMASIKPGEFDAMLTVPTAPIDNALKAIILPHIERLKIPLFTHSRPLAEMGAFASYGANFYDLGEQSARLALKILKGIDASKIPFETPKKYTYTINQDVQEKLRIEFSTLTQSQINERVITREKQ